MIEKFMISEDASALDALARIDSNGRDFLFVADEDTLLLGVVRESGIRKQLLETKDLHVKIIYDKNYPCIKTSGSFDEVAAFFKERAVDFLPIIDKSGKIINYLTDAHFHYTLLHDQAFDLAGDFDGIDEDSLRFEIFNRPWGFYMSTIMSDFVQAKIITVFPGGELSYQEHKKREEHWIVIKGQGKVYLDESIIDVSPGRYIYIPKGCKHEVLNSSKTENLIFSEVQLGSYFGEDDIIRYSDKYGRVNAN